MDICVDDRLQETSEGKTLNKWREKCKPGKKRKYIGDGWLGKDDG